MNTRQKLISLIDVALGALLSGIVLGAILGFGGAAWWCRPVLVAGAGLSTLLLLTRQLLEGRARILKSPLGFLGFLVLALAVAQLAPLPGSLAGRISPSARELYAQGALLDLARADDPEAAVGEAPLIRSPASVDRSATLRGLILAATCLGVFWCVSHYVDRLQRLYLIWGAVIAGFLLNAALAVVQISAGTAGFFGFIDPGAGPWWSPTVNDLLDAPAIASLRDLPTTSVPGSVAGASTTAAVPFTFGTLPGGVGGFLALGALALPLALAVVMHLIAPAGSREPLLDRLNRSGHGGLVVLLSILLVLGAGLVGLTGGFWFAAPVGVGLAMVGVPAVLLVPGARWSALGASTVLLGVLAIGAALQTHWPDLTGARPPAKAPDWRANREVWKDAAKIFREFPIVGAGLGSFPVVQPYFKDRDLASTTAMSSLLQWGAETGLAGLSILAMAALISLIRVPGGLARVGAMDRFLALGLLGSIVGFSLLATIHWTVELPAVAVAASALGGTWNRWLAGGADLFVERG